MSKTFTKMKTILLIIVVTAFSCISDGKKTKDASDIQIEQEKKILYGTWSICKKIKGNNIVSYNICKKMILMPNMTGEFFSSSSNVSKFKWENESNKIIFSFATKKDKELFLSDNSAFRFTSYQKNNVSYLEFVDILDDVKFILSKN